MLLDTAYSIQYIKMVSQKNALIALIWYHVDYEDLIPYETTQGKNKSLETFSLSEF